MLQQLQILILLGGKNCTSDGTREVPQCGQWDHRRTNGRGKGALENASVPGLVDSCQNELLGCNAWEFIVCTAVKPIYQS